MGSLSSNHYAISVKMTMVFIDEWPQSGTVYVHRDNTSTEGIVSNWTYDTKGAYGEQLCGTNKMDYILRVSVQLNSRNANYEDLYITTNQE